ncbi:MAG: hypothetical protein Unbinned5081contig1001_41 [Prokaryotic dsDNA virus sp.]|nr:MAG: hypothetical protein Unbinned5081contig1001_41 [Prokaryotic dsDNA virus sp.]|tara:strand:- start:17807 stop:18025 length:219 start_codon:yes stop_codon:yes gene_type:complete
MPAPTWTDEQALEALHLRDFDGWSCQDIADRFGKTKNSVVGMLNRIDGEGKKHDPDGNQNGTMKPLWWRRKC